MLDLEILGLAASVNNVTLTAVTQLVFFPTSTVL